jgi:beta-lactamase class D
MINNLTNKIATTLMLVSFASLTGEETFILVNGNTNEIVKEIGPDIHERVTPACSFNIVLSLMGYDSEILQDEKRPIWDFQEGYDDFSESWKVSQTPESWMSRSCVWYSKIIGLQLGLETIQNYLVLLEYGNRDMSGGLAEPGMMNPAWISSSLKISPKEQVDFIQKMVSKTIALPSHVIERTRTLLLKEELPGGWRLYGKAGLGTISRQDDSSLEVRWFVGWIENNRSFFPFAYQMREKEIDVTQTIPRVKQLIQDSNIMNAKEDYKNMVSVRDYNPEDTQELANIYFNTVHRINIKDYTQDLNSRKNCN